MQNKIDKITDILRRDDGISGAMHYTEQIGWILFLKFLDDYETNLKDLAFLDGKDYKSILQEKFSWSVWAAPKKNGKLDVKNALSGLIDFATSLPTIAICIGITVIALYFICVDKIYILDQLEHHMPRIWVKKLRFHLKEITHTLGGYLKAEASLVLISFIISLIRIIYISICWI